MPRYDTSSAQAGGTIGPELAHRVAASCTAMGVQDLAAALAAGASDPASYEASVRRGSTGTLRVGRMMIEQASGKVVVAIATALRMDLPSLAQRWILLAQEATVPLIAGWDLRGGGGERCLKVYVNASDASRAVRAWLGATLLADDDIDTGDAPAVFGMNARADGVTERKLYLQSRDANALAADLGARATALAAAARQEGADAGGVLSLDVVNGTTEPRAFFVALREPQATDWHCVRSLPGYDKEAIESLLPFPPAPPRSVGVSLADDSWTAYFKPRNSSRAPESLEPVAIFRLDGAEVGVFVEPTQRAARAFRRTERHAVSIRMRHGTAEPTALESLVDWFTDQLRAAERDGERIAARLGNPPAPWQSGDAIAEGRS